MFEYMTVQEAAENRRKVQSREQKEAEKERQYVMRQEKKKLSIGSVK